LKLRQSIPEGCRESSPGWNAPSARRMADGILGRGAKQPFSPVGATESCRSWILQTQFSHKLYSADAESVPLQSADLFRSFAPATVPQLLHPRTTTGKVARCGEPPCTAPERARKLWNRARADAIGSFYRTLRHYRCRSAESAVNGSGAQSALGAAAFPLGSSARD